MESLAAGLLLAAVSIAIGEGFYKLVDRFGWRGWYAPYDMTLQGHLFIAYEFLTHLRGGNNGGRVHEDEPGNQ